MDLRFNPVVLPWRTKIKLWKYEREIFRRRNAIERLFRRLKGYRRISSRFEKLDVIFIAFISFALIAGTALVSNGPIRFEDASKNCPRKIFGLRTPAEVFAALQPQTMMGVALPA